MVMRMDIVGNKYINVALGFGVIVWWPINYKHAHSVTPAYNIKANNLQHAEVY